MLDVLLLEGESISLTGANGSELFVEVKKGEHSIKLCYPVACQEIESQIVNICLSALREIDTKIRVSSYNE